MQWEGEKSTQARYMSINVPLAPRQALQIWASASQRPIRNGCGLRALQRTALVPEPPKESQVLLGHVLPTASPKMAGR
jgi:hypothetical protein